MMDEKAFIEYGKKVASVWGSFRDAVHKAGGHGSKSEELSIDDLIYIMARNNIRFVYEPPKDPEQ